jgi:glyoxylase-like metal-dependent hydrolase (beta-lactamase superfamily II)
MPFGASAALMRVHHLNCGTMCPLGHWALGTGQLACHCLLLETGDGLALIDTGFGLEDVRRPLPRLSRLVTTMLRPRFDAMDTAIEQVRDLGFRPADVRHIILTHLDFDHAGGIADFPAATVHLLADEAAAARHRRGWIARRRYRPAQWRAAARWQEYGTDGEPWFGFAAVRQLRGLPPDILLVPLPGHSAGHCGVALNDGARWLLHAGDAYLHHGEMHPRHPRCPPGLRGLQWLMQTDGGQRRANQRRLRELLAGQPSEVTVFCSHDQTEWLAQRRAEDAVPRARPKPRAAPRDTAA